MLKFSILLVLNLCFLVNSAHKDKNELSKDSPKDGSQEYNPLGALVRYFHCMSLLLIQFNSILSNFRCNMLPDDFIECEPLKVRQILALSLSVTDPRPPSLTFTHSHSTRYISFYFILGPQRKQNRSDGSRRGVPSDRRNQMARS